MKDINKMNSKEEVIHEIESRLEEKIITVPSKINLIKSLSIFSDFNQLKTENGGVNYNFFITNLSLNTEHFDFLANKSAGSTSSILTFAGYIIGIPLLLYLAINTANYWLLLNLIAVPVGQMLTGALVSGKYYLPVIIASMVAGYFNYFGTSSFLFILWFSMFTTQFLKNYKRTYLMDLGMNSEGVFCILFTSGIINIWNNRTDSLIEVEIDE